MATSLNQFRTQYPEGGLVTELLSIHDGQYVVRAVASHKGITLGSGLASSVDVQIAEDKARDRALAVLGIFADEAQSADTPSAPISPPQETEQKTSEAPKPLNTPAATNELLKPSDASTLPEKTVSDAPVPEGEEDLGPPIDEVPEEPSTPPESAPPESKVSAAVIALENFNTSTTPVDLSDVIAQTDVELTRLGWYNAQGREYLEKTYGKVSRIQLTDEELMSFLLYLEEQP